jgi:hypothetical protein
MRETQSRISFLQTIGGSATLKLLRTGPGRLDRRPKLRFAGDRSHRVVMSLAADSG